jgi:hypothetical protein
MTPAHVFSLDFIDRRPAFFSFPSDRNESFCLDKGPYFLLFLVNTTIPVVSTDLLGGDISRVANSHISIARNGNWSKGEWH